LAIEAVVQVTFVDKSGYSRASRNLVAMAVNHPFAPVPGADAALAQLAAQLHHGRHALAVRLVFAPDRLGFEEFRVPMIFLKGSTSSTDYQFSRY